MRLVFCVARKQDIPSSEFRNYWRGQEHKDKMTALLDFLKPDSYCDTLAAHLPGAEEELRKMGSGIYYDAVIEFNWLDETILNERLGDRAVLKILKLMRENSSRRIDPERSSIFFTATPITQDNSVQQALNDQLRKQPTSPDM